MAFAPAPTPEDTVRLFQAGELGPELARFHQGDDENLFIAQCVALHNNGEIDLLSVAETPAFAAVGGHSFFTAQHLYCEAIPKLRADATALVACCSALIKQAGKDGAASQPNGAFQQWCVSNPEQAQSVVARAKAGDELARQFVVFALRAANGIETAAAFVQTFDDDRRISGMMALAHMKYADATVAHGAISVMLPFVGNSAEDGVRLNALLAAFDVLKVHPDAAIAGQLVQAAVANADPLTLHGLTQVVWFHPGLLDDATLDLALKALQAIAPENLGTINILDMALRHLLGTPRESLALDYLTEKLRNGTLTVEHFDSVAHELQQGDSDRLYKLVVRWLLSGSIVLCNNVSDLVGVSEEQAFDATIAPLALMPVQQIFLCRKAIGYLFIKPVVCCSIIVSVLRAAAAEVVDDVSDLLFDPILLSYGGAAKDYLKGIAASDAAYPAVQSALAKDASFYKGLDSTGTIKELHPSDYQRNVIRQRTQDEMRQIHKIAESKSVFINLVHRSTLLYGKRSLNFVSDPAGGKRRAIAMDLKSFGTSIELPRREVLDPVGLDYMLRVFRVEKFK
jgi:hypothetical protein